MNDARRAAVDRETVVNAFDVMGRYLRERSLIGEIAVYGGTAIMLQFRWRTATDDVDVTIRTGERESAVKDAAALAATRLGLADDWLNNYVGALHRKPSRRRSSSHMDRIRGAKHRGCAFSWRNRSTCAP